MQNHSRFLYNSTHASVDLPLNHIPPWKTVSLLAQTSEPSESSLNQRLCLQPKDHIDRRLRTLGSLDKKLPYKWNKNAREWCTFHPIAISLDVLWDTMISQTAIRRPYIYHFLRHLCQRRLWFSQRGLLWQQNLKKHRSTMRFAKLAKLNSHSLVKSAHYIIPYNHNWCCAWYQLLCGAQAASSGLHASCFLKAWLIVTLLRFTRCWT